MLAPHLSKTSLYYAQHSPATLNDLKKPPYPPSAFCIYSQQRRKELKAENPSMTQKLILKVIKREWKAVDKLAFVEQAQHFFQDYRILLSEWKSLRYDGEEAGEDSPTDRDIRTSTRLAQDGAKPPRTDRDNADPVEFAKQGGKQRTIQQSIGSFETETSFRSTQPGKRRCLSNLCCPKPDQDSPTSVRQDVNNAKEVQHKAKRFGGESLLGFLDKPFMEGVHLTLEEPVTRSAPQKHSLEDRPKFDQILQKPLPLPSCQFVLSLCNKPEMASKLSDEDVASAQQWLQRLHKA